MDRSFKRQYTINIARMSEGQYEEEFDVNQSFFEQIEDSLIENGQVHVKLEMEKRPGYLNVWFVSKGEVEVACDRCSLPYMQPIDGRDRMIYSFDPEMKFEDDEVVYVSPEESHLSIAQEIYDFISLAVPMRRVPEECGPKCDPEVLKVLGLGDSSEENEGEEANADEPVDERWSALKKLRDQMKD